ncbi:Probable phosphoglycerate mutase [Corynebacterium kutscheri]|uniref:Fructose-2,6-bisphosphatase n=1 Tax=Corynebacterium kutscheri TaxID=35755 RepID=A0A0F6TC32_9CORY|nr:histidine phosphatase family protein [Corynebacterium kutscheri]AKE40491.1 fructose-2,6-bisphosphatase [Corynebacterium kutscheri]VEH05097.1 Probable phosphoglycerate mutase [Corynebacterium kutscheri]VEH10886.1 Probable phosphoglycerate mutase [Corynebacterium kutscheri]VEH80637.1 Probable phosphoglycerate mutase [Corynebacterium kutscheri]
MTTTIVHLVRHGEVFNPSKILYGRLPDRHLSARGVSMAHRTAESFRSHDVTVLKSSPLERAQETAAPIAEIVGLDIAIDQDLLEAGNRFEGLRVRGWRSQLWNPVRWPLLKDPRIPSWGEPYIEIRDRMMKAVEKARQEAEGHEAILVSHQLPIVCIQRDAQNLPLYHNPASRRCNLASVTSLVFQDDELIDYRYNEPAQDI